MPRRPLNFQQLRFMIAPLVALKLHGWTPSYISGDQSRGKCPFHGSTSRTSRTLSVGPVFGRCFKCGVTFDGVKCWSMLKGLDPLSAAYDLLERLNLQPPYLSS